MVLSIDTRILAAAAGVLVVAGAGGCSARSAPEQVASTAARLSAAAAPVAGYAHDLNHSRFRIGLNAAVEETGPTLVRWRGTLGAFSMDPTNNWSMASLNADSAVGPYEMDSKTHDDKVKSYFVNAGLPSDQVAAVITSYILTGSGQTGSGPGAPQLHSLNSTLRRAINGIAVPDSYAWAKMTTNGDVDAEAVFWPAIDASVVKAAQQFSNAMQDGAKHSQYLAKLPAVASEGGVVIHHSDPSIHSSPTAYVSFDAKVDAAGGAAMHHFDVNGVEFRLPHEANAASGSSRQRP